MRIAQAEAGPVAAAFGEKPRSLFQNRSLIYTTTAAAGKDGAEESEPAQGRDGAWMSRLASDPEPRSSDEKARPRSTEKPGLETCFKCSG